MELMGGVEQIRNSEPVEISRKERRPSHGVFKSVSKNLINTIILLIVFALIRVIITLIMGRPTIIVMKPMQLER